MTLNDQIYTFRVIWFAEDQEFVGLCTEFPSLSWLDNDQSKTHDGITTLVRLCCIKPLRIEFS